MFFFLLPLLISTAALAVPSPQRWLAFGDLRGHVESCGCDPRTDLGGLNRLHYFLQLEKKANSPFLLFNLGNNFTHPPQQRKDNTIVQFLAQLRPTAALLNRRELTRLDLLTRHGARKRQGASGARRQGVITSGARRQGVITSGARKRQKVSGATSHWLLSNHKARKHWWHKVITTPTAVVLGYTYTAAWAKDVQRFDQKMADTWQKILRQQRGKHSYLLFAGEQRDLQAIVRAVNFDTIISANTSADDAPVTHQEKLQPQRLARKAGKRQIHMVPLAGQGVLRGGAMLTNAVAADFGKIFSKDKQSFLANKKDETQSLAKIFRVTRVSWLDRAYADESAVFWQAYQRAVQKDFAAQERKGRKLLAASNFVGAAACFGCHQQQYQVWKNSAHARAMVTLQNKNKAQDGECVACHSVGFGAGGYVSLRFSSHLAGVQCENCHGARKAHILDPQRQAGVQTTFTCRKCHHPPHTAEFSQDAYWQKIKH